ncbi:Type I Iterative Polyketide synthase (PKS) [Aspergillus melleus]|uniref:Type I Iterative Polyketide synthase (PKS) n=1 Tax=Aspergillus melleus TaxID=138277 RepID=A0ACC3AS57_9EURO|nr:Type I Iterative Polyketide synthase (PKS) [Aspergillus melleus]
MAPPPVNGQNNGVSESLEPEAIAVTGFSLRFPQDATSPQKLWEVIQEARSVVSEVPPDRFNINGFHHPNASRNDTINSRGGHFLKENVAAFDAPFFSMNPSEVESMDPQQRGLLETTYRALENAGVPLETAAGSNTSVYVGALGVDYNRFFESDDEVHATYKATGNSAAILSNRLSWFYDLRGPSMTIETACSSSLIAMHLACQGLRANESRMSLVCGSQLYLEPLTSAISLSALQFMSPGSQCHSFDACGDGYGKGEGFVVLVLKRLSDALKDGDLIRAVIRATSTNQDGRTPGISQPSLAAQEDSIRKAYRLGGLDLAETRLFETHGAGTSLGDRTEAGAIRSVFQQYRSPEDPMYIGAVKANIGHLEAAAGLAGVVKTILSLEKGIIPPIAGLENLNPGIKAKEWHLRFPTKALPWPSDGVRRASVNAFGYGGSNAHAVLDDAYNYLRERGLEGNHVTVKTPPTLEAVSSSDALSAVENNGDPHNGTSDRAVPRAPFLFVLSASDSGGVDRLRTAYEEWLEAVPGTVGSEELRDLAYTLSNRRSRLPWKSFALADSPGDLRGKLTTMSKPIRSSTIPKLQFVFTGQGAQWARMGLELLGFDTFKASISQAEVHMKKLGSTWSLMDELQKPAESTLIDSPSLAQPLCTALQVALVELLRTWGITPWGVVGHSSGEIAAAFCAGALSRESAWTVAYFRGALAAKLAKQTESTPERGAMMAVGLSRADLLPFLTEIAALHGEGSLTVGCTNSAKNLTITGLEKSIDVLKARLDDEAIFARKLNIPVAYHSSHMEAIAEEYRSQLQSISPPSTSSDMDKLPLFVSSVSGKAIATKQLSLPDYWVRNLVSEVQFSEAITQLATASGDDTESTLQSDYYVEIGPHSAMQRAIKDNIVRQDVKYDTSMRRDVSALSSLQELAGKLWAEGYPVEVDVINDQGLSKPAKLVADLPEYPFNHSQTYWLESRLFKNYRFRDHIRHELLGIPTTDWNPLEPRFRFTIRVSDLPWLTDHQMNGLPVYPAAGMTVMAIEAARYLAKPGKTVKGYHLRDVSIYSALVVPNTPEGVESQIYLRDQGNSRTTGIKSIDCRDFRVSVYSDNEWRDVCAGSITIEYDEPADEVHVGDEDALTHNECQTRYQEALQRCSAKSTRDVFYETGHKVGYGFGPLFNTLHDIAYNPDEEEAVAVLYPDEWKAKVPALNADVQPHIIHPTTLDGVFQVTAAATTSGGTVAGPLQAPTQLRDVWISHDLLSRTPSTKLQVFAETTRQAVRETDSSMLVINADSGAPVIVIHGYRVTTVSSLQYTPSEKREIFYRLDWKPDVDMLDRAQVEEYCREKAPMPVEWTPPKAVVALYYMSAMLKELNAQGLESFKPHFQKYLAWVQLHFQHLGDSNLLMHSSWKEIMEDEARRTRYLNDFQAKGPVERAIHEVCRNLTSIVREETDPLELLFNQEMAKDLYADETFLVTGKRMATYIDVLAHKHSNMDILEIGGGTGSGTQHILSVLGTQGEHEGATPRYSSYTFTDISPSFFEKAKARFTDHVDRMKFQTLDIERSPVDQGFEEGRYDLVIASAVLHATECVADTLKHARSLLRPGGYLVLMEPTNKHDTVLNAIWGLLPGWWRSQEKDRSWSPLYSHAEWDRYLQQSGFTGLETALTDFPELDQHTYSLLLSRAAPDVIPSVSRLPESLLIATKTEYQLAVAQEIASYVKSNTESSRVKILTVDEKRQPEQEGLSSSVCISLLDLGRPFLVNMSESEFAALKQIVGSAKRIYWVTSGAGENATCPENAMSSGFSRAIMLEQPDRHITNVDLEEADEQDANPARISRAIIDILESSINVSENDHREGDYRTVSGAALIPRVVEAHDINNYVHGQTGTHVIEKLSVGKEPTEALQIQFTPGQMDSFRFVRDETHSQPLPADEVEVEVKSSGINFADVMCVLGQISDTYIGHEYAGVVRRVGSEVQGFAPGDRICGVGSGTFRTFMRSKVHDIIPIPDSLRFTDAVPGVWLTALYGIVHLGRLRQGESVLIHAAAGAVGQAAIQLAQNAGADVFVTVSSTAKKSLLQKQYGIPDNRFFSSRRMAFGKQILRATGGRGVDVILNSSSGEQLAETWRCIAPLGRFVEIGKRDIYSFQKLSMYPFSRNATFAALDLQAIYQKHPNVIAELNKELKELLFANKLGPPQPITTFSRADFESAFRYLQTGRHMGKAVIDWEAPAEIPYIPTVDPEYEFDPNASYVIAGGLGGIGRSLAQWIVDRGAKHLILLSRSGAVSEPSQELVRKLTRRGVNVAAPQCDISDAQMLGDILHGCTKTMPPIKGVIQATMVLRDVLFEHMTKEEWQAVLEPKVTGTWNLHHKLPQNLDFFVILSSLGGMIGAFGQSQYNGAGTFQDAFARHRWTQGQKCISIDVGLVTAVGYVAEQGMKEMWVGRGFDVLEEHELHSVVDWACSPHRTVSSAWGTQVLTAVNRPSKNPEKELLPYMKRPLYRHLRQTNQQGTADSSAPASSTTVDYGALIRAAQSEADAGRVIATALARKLSQALTVPEEDIDTGRPVHSFGVDSLVAVELRFWFTNQMKAEISVFNILANTSIQELGRLAASKSQFWQKSE